MKLQEANADCETAKQVIHFLRALSRRDGDIGYSVRDVLNKWIEPNKITIALFNNRGSFYDSVEAMFCRRGQHHQEHAYDDENNDFDFDKIVEEMNENDFDVKKAMENFKPASVDPERLFSACRLTQSYLQSRMAPQTLNRNVFLQRNIPLFQSD